MTPQKLKRSRIKHLEVRHPTYERVLFTLLHKRRKQYTMHTARSVAAKVSDAVGVLITIQIPILWHNRSSRPETKRCAVVHLARPSNYDFLFNYLLPLRRSQLNPHGHENRAPVHSIVSSRMELVSCMTG